MYQYNGASFIQIMGCPHWPQSIIYTNADLWLIGPLATTWVIYKTSCNIIHENTFENRVCEMAAVSLRSQCVQIIIPTRKMTLAMIPHYSDVIMDAMASLITSITIVYPSVYSGADQSSASLAFAWGIHRSPENVTIWWRHRAEHLMKWKYQRFPSDCMVLWRLYCLQISNDLDYGSPQTVICTIQDTNFRHIYASHIYKKLKWHSKSIHGRDDTK